MRQDS